MMYTYIYGYIHISPHVLPSFNVLQERYAVDVTRLRCVRVLGEGAFGKARLQRLQRGKRSGM
jgi:hypothetical protein